jgi:hypothetical protein
MFDVLLLPAHLDANPAMPENLHKKTPVFCRRRALVFVKNTGSRTRLFGNPAVRSTFVEPAAAAKIALAEEAASVDEDPWLCVTGLRRFCQYRRLTH